jgi:hypothetical protein
LVSFFKGKISLLKKLYAPSEKKKSSNCHKKREKKGKKHESAFFSTLFMHSHHFSERKQVHQKEKKVRKSGEI